MSKKNFKKFRRSALAVLMLSLVVIGIFAQTSKEKSFNEALTTFSLKNADVVNRLGDFQCPNVYDRPYSYLDNEVEDIETTCKVDGELSYSDATLKGSFSVGKVYKGTYVRKYCKNDDDRLVCCEVAEQGAHLINMVEK